MIQVIFLFLIIELPADIVQTIHRAVGGENYREASKGVYRCAGFLLAVSVIVLCVAISSLGQS